MTTEINWLVSQLKEQREKIEVYETLLHRIEKFAEVIVDNEKLKKLIGNICRWSCAMRNGELDNDKYKLVEEAFHKLLEI